MEREALIIEPHVGVGRVRFGMTASDVYALYGRPSFRRGPDDFWKHVREEFEAHCFFVDFDPSERCRSVEMYPDARVLLDGTNLMAMTYNELVGHLRRRGHSLREDLDGFRCDELGLACYAPRRADPDLTDAPVESLCVYPPGYWDAFDAKYGDMAQ